MISAALAFLAAASAVVGTASILGARPRRDSGGLARRLAAVVPARLKPPLDLAARLEAAGSPGNLRPAEFMGIKALAALAAAPAGATLATAAPGRLGPVLLVLAPVAGFFAPDLHLRKRTSARIRAARAELPNLLDLLRVAIDAGMAPSHALAAVGRRSDAFVAKEWARAADQVQLGVPLADALQRMTRRIPAPELQALTAAVKRATTHGAPLSDTLAAQARDARQARRRRIEEEAAKAAPKIQLVVALLLVPSVLLMVAAALAAALLGAVAH
ncbi:MAG TPA: type II secretion system F family protein [Thermoleophilaceae bacterium]